MKISRESWKLRIQLSYGLVIAQRRAGLERCIVVRLARRPDSSSSSLKTPSCQASIDLASCLEFPHIALFRFAGPVLSRNHCNL